MSPLGRFFVVFAALAIDIAIAACAQEDASSVSPFVDDPGRPEARRVEHDDSARGLWRDSRRRRRRRRRGEAVADLQFEAGVRGGECVANEACQIFLQTDTSYATLSAASRHAIKLFASAPVASYFNGVAVGDRVAVAAWAWRYDLGGQHELLLRVNALLPGCAKTTSTGHTLTPLEGLSLSDLTVAAYEDTHGPLFVKIANVAGKADESPKATFGLWQTTDGGFFDAGADGGANVVSLSPFFLPDSTFTGLVPSAITRFNSITAVFGLFVPNGGRKYLQLYPRLEADLDEQ